MYITHCKNCKKSTKVTEEEMQRSPKLQRVFHGESATCAFCYVGEVEISKSTVKTRNEDKRMDIKRHKLRFNNEEDLQAAMRKFEEWEWDGVQADNALSLLFSSEGELDERMQVMILQACRSLNYKFNMEGGIDEHR